MASGLPLYDLETVRELVGLILDRFTFNGEVQDAGLPELKEEIVRRLYD